MKAVVRAPAPKAAPENAPENALENVTAKANPTELEKWLEGFLRDPGFLQAYPYYAAVLGTLIPVADPSVKRMAVSLHEGRFFLHLNVDSFVAEPQFLRGILLHEVHHLVLGHLTHPKFTEAEEPELMDLAVEMSANEYINEPIPPAVTCRAYSALGIRPGQSTRERYEILLRSLQGTGKRPRPTPGEEGTATADDHRFFGPSQAVPGASTQAAMIVERGITGERDAENRRKKEQKKDKTTKPEIEDPKRYLIAGRSPAYLLEQLADTTRAPEEIVDWRTALALFAARSRSPVHTWSRPSRRFPSRIFEIPGRSWAARRMDNPRLLVAIDTSLSMARGELEEIARQLVILGDHAQVIIAECDVAIARIYPFAGKIDAVYGRGGTDLRPIFTPEVLGAHDVDGVVYFTDGDGPFPPEPPSVPVLWVLTKPMDFRCPWGEKARLRAPRR